MADQADVLATPLLILALGFLVRSDFREKRLPDVVTLPLICLGVALSAVSQSIDVTESILGAAIGFTLFWAIGAAHFAWRGFEGLGLGDAKLFAAAGAWLGWSALPMVLLIASVMALIAAMATMRSQASEIAFGPWLCVGILAHWTVRLF